VPWDEARQIVYEAGRAAAGAPVAAPLVDAGGATLAEPLVTLTPLPAFPTSSVDGYAVRGAGPWQVTGRVLAGGVAGPIAAGEAVEIATGAMVPAGTDAIVRVEDSTVTGGLVSGEPRPHPEWRETGDEAAAGEELLPAGTVVTPGVVGIAAACGYDTLTVRPRPGAAVLVFGDELVTEGPPRDGRVRDSLGPSLPGWLRALGAGPGPVVGPVQDTLKAHVTALEGAAARYPLVCTTGGTMHGPVDHLHAALAELRATYVVNTVKVRPGFPMMVARLPNGAFVAGLPGNPQSAVVTLVSLVAPLLAGLAGRAVPAYRHVTLGADVHGRGDYTHLALVRVEGDGRAYPLPHAGAAMLRGVARADGFAVVPPGGVGVAGGTLDLVPLPLRPGERP